MVGTVTGKFHSTILIKQGVLPHAVDGRLTPRRRWASYPRVNENVCKNIINHEGVCAARHGFENSSQARHYNHQLVVSAIQVYQGTSALQPNRTLPAVSPMQWRLKLWCHRQQPYLAIPSPWPYGNQPSQPRS